MESVVNREYKYAIEEADGKLGRVIRPNKIDLLTRIK